MGKSVTEKILLSHLCNKSGLPPAGEKIAVKIDQTLTQDATGTLTYIEFESLGIDRIRTELSVSYVDHNTLQTGFENADDHIFLKSIARKYGIIFSPPGNGICHQLHLENFAIPGKTLIGSDSHTPTCGALGMLAIGAGGLDIACALAGIPFEFVMPEIVKVNLIGRLSKGVSAKDIILELLRRLTVRGGVNKIFEYTGSGVSTLNIYQRATITNMGAELGLTTSIFPSDEITRDFMKFYGRFKQWKELFPDKDAKYSDEIIVELDKLEPLVACPHSPDNVKKVSELKNVKVDQVCIGSCTNSGFYDLMLIADVLKRNRVHPDVDLVISPGSRQVLFMLEKNGALGILVKSGARILEPACGPCIGIGQAPRSSGVSLRTYNRNFKGRCGTESAEVYISSPEVAIATAITGKITDPRKFISCKKIEFPSSLSYKTQFIYPDRKIKDVEIIRGPNIKPLPLFDEMPDTIVGKVLLKAGDNISTDDILPGGSRIMSYRSNIPAISEWTFSRLDKDFVNRAKKVNSGVIVAGQNYGQGSSREHAAIVQRYLGVRGVVAKSFARIHLKNLINFGVVPLVFKNPSDYDLIELEDEFVIADIRKIFLENIHSNLFMSIKSKNLKIEIECFLDRKDKEILISGGLLNYIKKSF